jgi:hypothetical protein
MEDPTMASTTAATNNYTGEDLATDHSALERLFGSRNVPYDVGSWDRVVENCVKPVVTYIPFLLACYGICLALIKKWYPKWDDLKHQKIAGSLSMYPAFFVLIYTSHATMVDTTFYGPEAHETRFHTSSYSVDLFSNFYIATNIVQAIGQLQTEKPPLLYQLMAHHVLSVACYASGFYFDRFRWWTAFAGCCEITNLFLVPVFACKEFFPEWKTETWYLYNSQLLYVTFLTHRLILFPCWLVLWFWDRWTHWEVIHWVEGVIYPVTILGLNILSIIWFLTIRRGLQKQTVAYMEAQQAQQQKNKKV